jgi:hypothetical protein
MLPTVGTSLTAIHTLEVQRSYFANFQQRILKLMKETAHSEHPLTIMQAEQLAWQQVLIKTGMTTQEEFDRLYREAELEMLSDDFCALWNFLTVWGEKP